MPRKIAISRTLSALRRSRGAFRGSVALVPTMGALHRGHLALVKEAGRRADRVVVSIFVNPTQFAPHEDFGSYPRTFASDIAALTEAKADLVWAPTAQVMYPDGFATRI
jgi:pantoate--beta-alanine ligase